MTSLQVSYWNLVETNRANVARETETSRANRMREQLTSAANEETRRHNLATEAAGILGLQQNQQLSLLDQAERARSNQANERIGSLNALTNQFNALENQRSHQANESAQLISLENTYDVQSRNADINQQNADTAALRAVNDSTYQLGSLLETERAHRAAEVFNRDNATLNAQLAREANAVKFGSEVLSSLANIAIKGGGKFGSR